MGKKDKIKVLFPIGSFYPAQCGGPSNTIYWMAEGLAKDDDISINIVSTNKGLSENVIQDKWIKSGFGNVIYCKTQNHIFSINFLWTIYKSLKVTDIVHLTSLFYFPSLFSAFLALIFNKKIIWSPRGELSEKALLFGKNKKSIVLFFIKLIAPKITFHSTSKKEKNDIEINFSKNNGVLYIPNLMKLPERVYSEPMENYILYIGRLHPIKSIDKIICGLKKSSEFSKSLFKFYIVGEGEKSYKDYLKNLIIELGLENKIVFKGRIEGQEKEEILAHSYFTFLVSESENFGNVVIESLAQSTPVVASFGTPWEQLLEFNAGYYIESKEEEISKVIDKILLLSKSEYSDLSNNSLKMVKKYDVKKNIDSWIDAYKNFIYG